MDVPLCYKQPVLVENLNLRLSEDLDDTATQVPMNLLYSKAQPLHRKVKGWIFQKHSLETQNSVFGNRVEGDGRTALSQNGNDEGASMAAGSGGYHRHRMTN